MKGKLEKIGLNLLSIPYLNKVRVFFQILTVIGIMVVFLILIGYIGIRNVNAMQEINKKMFDDTLRIMNSISVFKQNLIDYKDNYFQCLLDGNDNPYLRNNLYSSMEVRVEEIKSFNEKKAQKIVADLNELKKAADLPVSKENYGLISPKIVTILIDIKDIEYDLQGNSYTISSLSIVNSVRSKQITFVFIIVSTIIAVFLGLFISTSVSWPLKEIEKASKALAFGNLSYRAKIFGCREVTDVAGELNKAMEGLQELIFNISQQSGIISQASNELKTAANDSGRAAGEVAQAMDGLARAATNQSEQIYNTANTIKYFGEIVRHVSDETSNITTVSEKVAQSAITGQKVTDEVAVEINELYNSTREINEVIAELNKAMGKIGEITSEITEIAEQTTLLALNASIEAARAGEHGRGFSIVAVETGNLAERSKQASQHVSTLTEQMIGRANHAAEVTKKVAARAEIGKNSATKATVTFNEIFKELMAVVAKINEIAQFAQNMKAKNDTVLAAVTNITEITEESMASTQEISATAEEQSAMAQQVTVLSERLSNIADEMRQNAAVFQI